MKFFISTILLLSIFAIISCNAGGHEEECNFQCECIGPDPQNPCGDQGKFCLPANSTLGL